MSQSTKVEPSKMPPGMLSKKLCNIVSPIEMHGNGACASLTRNEDVATQPCEVGREILIDPRSEPKVILCYRLEVGAARAEGARIVRDDLDAFRANVSE